MFGMVPVKHRMREIGARARERCGITHIDRGENGLKFFGRDLMTDEERQHLLDFLNRTPFIQRKPQALIVVLTEIDLLLSRPVQNGVRLRRRQWNTQRVEHRLQADGTTMPAQTFSQYHRQAVNSLCNPPQPCRTVIDRIHPRHDGQQHLRRADIAGGLLAPDMLFPGLQRQAIGHAARHIFRDADDPARHLPAKLLLGGKKRRMGPTESKRDTEPLAGSDRHVRSEFSR